VFRVYKPKNIVRVKAVQVTSENIQALADLLLGRVGTSVVYENQSNLQIPTFDGAKTFEISQWILRDDDNQLSAMDNVDFTKAYEVARNVEKS
jgi:hypothetical protein